MYYDSCHSLPLHNNVPYGQFLRTERNITSPYDFRHDYSVLTRLFILEVISLRFFFFCTQDRVFKTKWEILLQFYYKINSLKPQTGLPASFKYTHMAGTGTLLTVFLTVSDLSS